MVTTFVAVANLPFAPKKFGDYDFHIEAKNLASFLRGAGGFETLAFTRAPGPSLFYAVPYLFVAPGSQIWPLWGTFVGLLAFHAVVYMEPRYLFPCRVIIAIIGSTVLEAPVRRVLARRKMPAAEV